LDSGKSFELERQSGYSRLVLHPSLNAYHWSDIEQSTAEILKNLESTKGSAVIVDLSPLDYLGSAQVTLLVRVWKAVKSGEGRMVVLVTAPVVRDVLNTAGLSSIWNFADSLPDAYQTLGLQVDGRPRMSLLGPIIGLVALAGALTAVCASYTKTGGLNARTALIMALSCSAVALAAGMWTIARGTGMRRGLGVGMVLASAVLAAVQVLHAPK
jgi:anti-anti-sigma factor